MNAKRIIDSTTTEGLDGAHEPRKRLASRARVPLPAPRGPMSAGRWTSSARGWADGRWFRTLTVLDLYTHEASDRSRCPRRGG